MAQSGIHALPHFVSLHAGYHSISQGAGRAIQQSGGKRMNFVVPAPSETFDIALEDGASIRVRRHGNRDGVRLTVTHGNGFAADAYLPFWQHLTPHYDVLVFDFRNHGQNVPVEPANHNYAQLSRDLD